MKLALKYARIWGRLAQMSLMNQLSTKMASLGFLLGKLMRFGFFLVFIIAIFRHAKTLSGYSLEQTVFFFLTFNLIDIAAQFLFRGMYGVRTIVENGDFDYYLSQPLDPLFRIAIHMTDFLDLLSLVPVLAMLAYSGARLPGASWGGAALYFLLIGSGIAIATAMHIAVAGVAVWTQELENTIWVYRDLMTFGRFPVDIYSGPVRWVLTFVIPIAVIVSFPAQAMMGRLAPIWVAYSLCLAAASLAASLAFWRLAVRNYTSVSS